MGSLTDSCEIVEVREEPLINSRKIKPISVLGAGDNDRKLPSLKLGRKSSQEDDIDRLFESINLKASSKGLGTLNHVGTSTSPLRRNALKKPITIGMPRTPAIGAPEPVSLKQALRDICISKASEMAALRRLSKSSSSPRISEAERIKYLYNSVVVESTSAPGHLGPVDQGKDSTAEISLVPADAIPSSSEKRPHQYQSKDISNRISHSPTRFDDATEQNGTKPTPIPNAIVSASEVQNQELETGTLREYKKHAHSISHPDCDDDALEKDAHLSPTLTRKAVTTKSVRKSRSHTVPSSSSNSNRLSRLTINVSRVAKPAIRNQSSAKKKTKKDSTSISALVSTSDKVSGVLDPNTSQLVCERCYCSLKNARVEVNHDSVTSNSTSHVSEVDSNDVKSNVRKSDSSLNNCNRKIAVEEVKKLQKSKEKGEFSQSSKSSGGEYSSSTSISDESNVSRCSSGNRPHMSKDVRWQAIRDAKMHCGVLGLKDFNLLKKLGCGDIGTVYLAELVGTNCLFAIKVMDNEFLARRNKMHRAQSEREILRMLDHPFLPTLFSQFTSDNLSCLVMEYCPGGDLHVLRQKQVCRSFSEPAARFYVAEALLALEYLHMLGVIYRDLKPENILVREDGHIMLTDFDLSLRCTVSPTLVKLPSNGDAVKISGPCSESSCIEPFCIKQSCQVPCFSPRFLPSDARTRKSKGECAAKIRSLPQLVAEPTDARSNSFVGTHEYLAPEIIKGDGHGAAVDWWTFGIFLYELLYGKTPFKGSGNEETLANVVLQSLKFPDIPIVSFQARDLIKRLLVKEPENRLGSEKGAAEIKSHPFFEGLNWALVRCAIPPELPELGVSNTVSQENESTYLECKTTGENLEFELY